MDLQTAKELDIILDRFKMSGGKYISEHTFSNKEWSHYPELYIKKLEEMGYIKMANNDAKFHAGGNHYVTTFEGFMSKRFEDILIDEESKRKTEKTNRIVLIVFTVLASLGTVGLLGFEVYKYSANDNVVSLESENKSLIIQMQQAQELLELESTKELNSRVYYNELLKLRDSLATNKRSGKK